MRRFVLALCLLAFAGVIADARSQPYQFDALGQGPFPVEVTLMPGLYPEYYDVMLCSPLNTRCGWTWYGGWPL